MVSIISNAHAYLKNATRPIDRDLEIRAKDGDLRRRLRFNRRIRFLRHLARIVDVDQKCEI